MNVRNLSQYITKLCGKETLDLLGSNKELLLQKIFGQDPSSDQIKVVISDAASFASNAEEQLFYEFVQNAYDANADSLFFYANEKHLIVLNNGEPFYTDFDIFESDTIRDGQLYNFLAKGKSSKRNDNSKLGKYGQGSKLLYTLLTDVSESEENEDLLVKALYDEKKGPYLISWYNRNQLANLLQEQGNWIQAAGDNYQENILFAKILMSYYPIAPGTSEELFSTKEALDAISAFNTLVNPRRNLNFLNRGTALIIPLGKGKYEKITSNINMERVRARLGVFASITKDQDRNDGKTVEHIYVMGEEVEQHEVQSVFVNFKIENNPFHYHFAFNPVFAERLVADEKLLRIFIKITDKFLDSFYVQESEGNYIIQKKPNGYNYVDAVSSDLQDELSAAHFFRIPDKVQEILNVERKNYFFASNENMLEKAIERIQNPIKLFSFAKNAGTRILGIFFNYLKSINIDTAITKASLEWQVIEFAAQRNTEENRFIETVFRLLRHKGQELPKSITQQHVSVGVNEYDVYLLNEDYQKDNEAIDSFVKCLPSQNEAELFKKRYYDGKEDKVSTEDLFEKLKGSYLTVEQLKFCIDYAITNEESCDDLEIGEDVNLTDALDMILGNNFSGFDRHFKMDDVDLEKQVYANHDILIQDEFLPNVLHNWIVNNPRALFLFSRLHTAKEPYIAVRQTLLDDMVNNDTSWILEIEQNAINNTISWAIEKKLTYAFGTNRFNTMIGIIEKLPSDLDPMPFLKYTGKVSPSQNESDSPKPIFVLERYKYDGTFLSWHSWAGTLFQERLAESPSLAKFIREQNVYLYDDKELLFKHHLDNSPIWIVQASADFKEFPEYDNSVYQRWKKTDDSKGITIHTSEKPIVMNFNIMASDASIFADKMHDSEFGYELGKRVVIQQPNKDRLSLMKTIAKHIASMEFFKGPFIALQSLYVDQLEHMQQEGNGKSIIDISNSPLTEKQAQEVIQKISTETATSIELVNNITTQLNSEDLYMLNDAAKPIKNLLEGLKKDDIEKLAENKDKLMQMIDDLEEAGKGVSSETDNRLHRRTYL